jgi:hypothetical protein
LRDNHVATIMPMPRRQIPILIVAPFLSSSPRYSSDRQTPIWSAIATALLQYWEKSATVEIQSIRVSDRNGRPIPGRNLPVYSRSFGD